MALIVGSTLPQMADTGDPESAAERRNALNARLRLEAIARLQDTPPGRAHAKLVEAVRLLLAAYEGEQPSDGSGIDLRSHQQFSESLAELQAMPGSLYQAVAVAAATIRWASHETDRTEAEILAELARNFTESDPE